ncbi:MAG: hypothetical protein A2001_01395 [Treponema sp. GWC1_61_84]|nr:MAG: hypothetical protein A2001_01395 [Treponema sp. GWC1_61_84]
MPPEQVCAAHGILYDLVVHLRENQSQLYDLAWESAKRTAGITTEVETLSEATKAGFAAVSKRQDASDAALAEGFAEMRKLIATKNRRRWSPAQIVALITAVVGPTGIAAYVFWR